jgi:AcrR family transcriptional regulator
MGKGTLTRGRILDRAVRLASAEGLDGISIARLAETVGMSKSGLFAHFRSKEELELGVVGAAVERFTATVVRPALAAPRGEPRVRALVERWLEWERHETTRGCVFVQLGVELHDRPGATRDAVVDAQRRWLEALARAAAVAVEEGHFRRDLDTALFAFRQYGVMLSYYHTKRVLSSPDADRLAVAAFDALIADARPH